MKRFLMVCCLYFAPAALFGATYEEHAVASVLMGEAWSEGPRGMTAVADVIHQRTLEKHETPLQVISAHAGRVHAFSCLNRTTVDKLIQKFSQQPGYTKALQLAQLVCQTPDRLPGLVKTANHYTRLNERPYWARGKHPIAIVGKHAFYRLERY